MFTVPPSNSLCLPKMFCEKKKTKSAKNAFIIVIVIIKHYETIASTVIGIRLREYGGACGFSSSHNKNEIQSVLRYFSYEELRLRNCEREKDIMVYILKTHIHI